MVTSSLLQLMLAGALVVFFALMYYSMTERYGRTEYLERRRKLSPWFAGLLLSGLLFVWVMVLASLAGWELLFLLLMLATVDFSLPSSIKSRYHIDDPVLFILLSIPFFIIGFLGSLLGGDESRYLLDLFGWCSTVGFYMLLFAWVQYWERRREMRLQSMDAA